MFAKKPPSALTISPRDPLPKPPGSLETGLRPPPKTYIPYREFNGYSPHTVKKMLYEKKKYEEECERVETEREIALFELRNSQTRQCKNEKAIPTPLMPTQPKIDKSFINCFEKPCSTNFYDYKCPDTRPKTSRQHKVHEKSMARGCPCCNPHHYDDLKAEKVIPYRNGRQLQKFDETTESTVGRECDDLPLKINQTLWNILDEPFTIERNENKPFENYNAAPFKTGKVVSQDGRIPLISNELRDSARRGEKNSDIQVSKRMQKERNEEVKVLHERSCTSRNFNKKLNKRTKDIGIKSKQNWATDDIKKSNIKNKDNRRKQKESISKDEFDALHELDRYDNALYQEYKDLKVNPSPEFEFMMLQNELNFRM